MAKVIGLNWLDKAKQLGGEIIDHRWARMFGRNTVASTGAFLLDLAILWCLVELAGLPRLPAAVLAFMIPMALFYILERVWVFPDSDRGVASGFVYFMVNIGIGFLVMLAIFWGLLQFTSLHYLLARVIASAISGVVIFLLNGIFNFKEL
jgi:putative flippase GtrA